MAGETQTGNATIVFSIPGKDLSDNEIEKIREIPQSKPQFLLTFRFILITQFTEFDGHCNDIL